MFSFKHKTVEDILKAYPDTRGNDKLLILKVWEDYNLILTPYQRQKFMSKELPSTETIRRTRQKLQECGRYMPVKEVQVARQQLAEETRNTIMKQEPLW